MSIFVCGLQSMFKKLGENVSPKHKKKMDEQRRTVAQEMNRISKEFETGSKYKNIKDTKRNDWDHMEWIWEKFTNKVFDPTAMPHTIQDVRKFEAGLKSFEAALGAKQGILAQGLKLPKRVLSTLPELKRFEQELTNETQFFRDYNVDTGKKINSFLKDFQSLAKLLGGDIKGLTKLEGRLNSELQLNSTLTGTKLAESNKRLNSIQQDFIRFYESGAGDAHKLMQMALEGAPISKDMGMSRPISGKEQALLKSMVTSFNGVRKRSVPMLVRALERIKILAKERDLGWVDAQIDRINSQIRRIEFQDLVTDKNKIVPLDAFKPDFNLMKLGFSGSNHISKDGKVALKHYMPKYTLGILNQINTLHKDVIDRKIAPTEQLTLELNKTDSLINRVKGRSPIADDRYSVDPFFFLHKYAGDVAIFNYRSHVKDTFRRAHNELVNEHLKPAEAAGNKQVMEATETWAKTLVSVYESVNSLDPRIDTVGNDLVRMMQSVTYFRLLGGNVRSAARNATQRLYEFVEYGRAAHKEGRDFYVNHESSDVNKEMVNRQKKIYGLQWFDGKSVKSKLLDSAGSQTISEASRGALQENFYTQKGLAVNEHGEIVMSKDRFTQKAARVAADIAQKSAFMHKIVEDANRAGTFDIAFALAHQNLKSMPAHWIYSKIMKSKTVPEGEFGYTHENSPQMKWVRENQKQVNDWIESTAGRMAYNATVDLHFEYADWNKARALKGPTGKFLGQFLHYRFSMFDLMHKWVSDAYRSLKAQDYSSDEVWKLLRYGILTGTLGVASSAAHMNFQKLFNNDVLDTADTAYTWLTTDRNNPDEVANLEKKTYGQGGFYFLGPNVNWLLSMYEMSDVYYADSDSIAKQQKSLEGIDDRETLYKTLALLNAQAARSAAYTWPVFLRQGLIPALQLEFGQFESKEQRATRNIAFQKFEKFAPKTAKFLGIKSKKKKSTTRSSVLQSQLAALDLLQS